MRADMWDIETALYSEGYSIVAGVDEAGRGPLAGDVYAAAVILPRGTVIDGLDDSKKLTPRARERLFDEIIELAEGYGIASASVAEIEQRNILGATHLAMNRALDLLRQSPKITKAADTAKQRDFIALIDGNQVNGITHPCRAVIKGDSRSANIAAASILAKVSRDRYMDALALKYPGYGFESNRGYGTAEHREAIKSHGATPEHRSLFLRKLI
ncbi:MAG: ribonuclease HII [Oscillospiraceae bacterium]|nr:ribonuclease HII [Oscillospiraceae bacterium]